jgi:hypothetical protein
VSDDGAGESQRSAEIPGRSQVNECWSSNQLHHRDKPHSLRQDTLHDSSRSAPNVGEHEKKEKLNRPPLRATELHEE